MTGMRFLIVLCGGSVVVEILMMVAVSIVKVVAACGPSGMAAMHRTIVLVTSAPSSSSTAGMSMISSTMNHITVLLVCSCLCGQFSVPLLQ
jgi:hypothetical protein